MEEAVVNNSAGFGCRLNIKGKGRLKGREPGEAVWILLQQENAM